MNTVAEIPPKTKKTFIVGVLGLVLFLPELGLCDAQDEITTFKQCIVDARYPEIPTHPPSCSLKFNRMLIQDMGTTDEPNIRNLIPGAHKTASLQCKDLCGDGVCQKIVCMGDNCPCAETTQSCSQDCR